MLLFYLFIMLIFFKLIILKIVFICYTTFTELLFQVISYAIKLLNYKIQDLNS